MLKKVIFVLAASSATVALGQQDDVVFEDGPVELSKEEFAETVSTNAPAGAKGMIVRVKKTEDGSLSDPEFRFTKTEKDAAKDIQELWNLSEDKDTEVTGRFYRNTRFFRVFYYNFIFLVPVYYFVPVYRYAYTYYVYYW